MGRQEKWFWGGNLQGTALHRGHRREGLILLGKYSTGEMSLVMEKVGSEYVRHVEEGGM